MIFPAFACPDEVGQDFVAIELHDVDFATVGPTAAAGRPDGGPEAGEGFEPGSDFVAAKIPLVLPNGDQGAGSVL